jgi:hypothetical protein
MAFDVPFDEATKSVFFEEVNKDVCNECCDECQDPTCGDDADEDCSYCTTTKKWLKVTLNDDMTFCTGCNSNGPTHSWTWDEYIAVPKVFYVEQVSACQWRSTFALVTERTNHASADCSGTDIERDSDEVTVTVTKTGANTATLKVVGSPYSIKYFMDDDGFTVTDCMNGTATNELNDCDYDGPSRSNVYINGTASVEDVT